MKFLRTKTTIFEVVEENERVYRVKSKKDPSNIYSKSKSDSDIVKTADTIKELCDEFYIDYGKTRFPYSTYRQHERYAGWGDLIRYLRTIHFAGYDGVYGYIWSGNELKLVAQMNKKGELELLWKK